MPLLKEITMLSLKKLFMVQISSQVVDHFEACPFLALIHLCHLMLNLIAALFIPLLRRQLFFAVFDNKESCEEYEAYFHIFSSHGKKETLLSFIVHENLYISFVY